MYFKVYIFRFLYILYLYSAGESTSSFPLDSSIAFATGRNKVCISTLIPYGTALNRQQFRRIEYAFFLPF